MQSFSKNLTARMLKTTLDRACVSYVPRSGHEGETVNCYITKVHQGDNPPPVVVSFDGEELGCTAWDGNHYGKSIKLDLRSLDTSQFEVVHFYGLSEVRYSSVLDYFINRTIGWPYLKIHAARIAIRLDQYFFNLRKLQTQKRNQFLSSLIERRLSGQKSVSPVDLLASLYTNRLFEHPDWRSAQTQLDAQLEALVESGELTKEGHKYKADGKAFRVIEQSKEEERRHTENVKVQRRIVWLTVAVAVFAAAQAGLIKLPLLLDLSR